MTVVCAPAGSGKSVLLRSWAAETDTAVAWVTVERGERDAQRFWLQVIGAVADAAGDELIERVSPAPQFAGAVVLERLLAQLERLEEPLVLVIDDLHELGSDDALGWLEMLLTRLPPRLRVVLATREEPTLGLHRLRLAGELTELRGHDLRFSLDETRSLLRAGGITLSNTGLDSLHERTEGWPAGLRLAAISLTTHPDPQRFVSEFSGSERTVAGYLLAEVLERQPPEVRDLLLQTSILERVSGPLADVLTGAAGPRRSSSGSKTRTRSSPRSTPPARGSATTTCSPIYCASNCGASHRRRSRRCTAPRPPGTNGRATSSKPCATIRQPVIGRPLHACWSTTTTR